MARITSASVTATTPIWMGDFTSRDHIRPGGSRLVAGDFTADAAGVKFVQSGTLVGRTFAERAAGTGFGPAVATDEEFYLTAFDVADAAINADVTLYRPGSEVKENYLPGFSGLAAALQAKIRAIYVTILGVN